MRLKIYQFTNPKTKEVEELYEYPELYVPPTTLKRLNSSEKYKDKYFTFVSKEQFKLPILAINNKYLKELENQRLNLENTIINIEFCFEND